MYAVVRIGSEQYKVSEGDTIEVNRLEDQKDAEVQLDQILMFANGNDIKIGQPFVSGVKITAKVVDSEKQGDKLIAFKYRRRKHFANKKGHRQQQTVLTITKISAN